LFNQDEFIISLALKTISIIIVLDTKRVIRDSHTLFITEKEVLITFETLSSIKVLLLAVLYFGETADIRLVEDMGGVTDLARVNRSVVFWFEVGG
jgi:hypothetical protein